MRKTPVPHEEFVRRFNIEKTRYNKARQQALDDYYQGREVSVPPSIRDIISVQAEYNWLRPGKKSSRPSRDTEDRLEQIGFKIRDCMYDFEEEQ